MAAKTISDEDLIKLSRACGVSHDLAEILREKYKDIGRDVRIAGHLDLITQILEEFIEKHSDLDNLQSNKNLT